MVSDYIGRLVDAGDYQAFGWMIRDGSEYNRLFGDQLRNSLTKIMQKVGGLPQMLRAIGNQESVLLWRIELLKKYFPELNKLIPFNACNANSTQLEKIEKLVGRRFKTNWSNLENRISKQNKRRDDINSHKNNEPWIRQDSEGGMHQPFESKLNKVLNYV